MITFLGVGFTGTTALAVVLLLASGALDLELLGSGVGSLGEEESVLLPLLDSSFFFNFF